MVDRPGVDSVGVTARDSPPTDDEEEEAFDIPSIEAVQQEPADPTRFDTTFTARRGEFNIGGEISSPTGFPLQAIPRLAYVLNYNLIYDEEAGKWVPQKKSDLQDDGPEQEDPIKDGGEIGDPGYPEVPAPTVRTGTEPEPTGTVEIQQPTLAVSLV